MKIQEERIDGKSFGEDIKSVYDPREVSKQRQNQTYPKLYPATISEKDSKRRQEDSEKNIYESSCSHLFSLALFYACEKLNH